jgi:hypothetical protein
MMVRFIHNLTLTRVQDCGLLAHEDKEGREKVIYGKLVYDVQDNGKTLKVFNKKKACKKSQLEDVENKCIFCKSNKAYSEEYDAYYCPKCLYWTELICKDRKCCFCSKRPKYPRKNQK